MMHPSDPIINVPSTAEVPRPLPNELVEPIASAIVAAPGDLTDEFLEAQRSAAMLFAYACAGEAKPVELSLLAGALARLAASILSNTTAAKVIGRRADARELTQPATSVLDYAEDGGAA